MSPDRIARQIAFIVEADKLKGVERRTPLTDSSRRENSGEHSWHLAVAAMTLHEYAPPGTDLLRVLEMLTVHDLVEIDAGDTFAYDPQAGLDKAEREQRAAARVFGLLPPPQAERFRGLWEEFEAGRTAEAHVAVALDRFQALLQNHAAGGGSWVTYQVKRAQVLARMAPIETALPDVWPFVLQVIDDGCAAGTIAR